MQNHMLMTVVRRKGNAMKLTYYILDVFTRDRLAGNPLAVVLKADELSDARMQAIAGEFNLSETVFVRTPKSERHTASLRIFTPRRELPFAGHPTVGASVLLGLENRLSAIRLELGIGLVTSVMERENKRTGYARFSLPQLPQRIDEAPDLDAVARTLGLTESDIGCGDLKPGRYSAGLPFYLIPVRDARVLESISLERRGWTSVYTGDHPAVYVFTKTSGERGNDYAARMFGVGAGIGEDPATGSAAAALIGLLAEQPEYAEGNHSIRLRQGLEMGRPSVIELQLHMSEGKLQRAGIGGAAVVLAQGVLDFDE